MHFIDRLTRTLSALFILIAMLAPTVTATNRRTSKDQRRRPAQKSRPPNKTLNERQRLNARRRAEAARLAALARQRAADEAIRSRVQSLISNDDPSGEDLEIRRIAVDALGNHAGTVVVMNPKTGRVYSIVNQQWALRESFKPCSTIKLVTGLAGLSEGVIDPQDTKTISDDNQVSLTRALAHSKNEYFQTVGGLVGFNKMLTYARQLGLGEKTGINVQNETAGRLPKGKSGYAVNHMSSHGDDFKVTAVQLATLVSAMSNGGKLLKPFLPRASSRSATSPQVRRTVNIDLEAFQSMLPGMIGAVNYGSGRRAFDPRETIAGKTGTCIDQGSWIGLFTSYAPVNDPELAVVVIAKGSDARNHFPAAVAGRIYRELNSRFASARGLEIAAKRSAPNNPPAALDDDLQADEEEADEASDSESDNKLAQKIESNKTIWGDQRRPADSKLKPTILPVRGRIVQSTKPGGLN